MAKILINGALKNTEDLTVSIDERGFRFGDGVFETIPAHAGLPYLWEYHSQRLEAGLAALRIAFSTEHLLKQACELIGENNVMEGVLRLYISRGIGSQGYLPTATTPTTVLQTLPPPAPIREPVALWLSAYEKISPKALPTHCKLAQGVNSTLARMEAVENQCQEALQMDAHGRISEASSANIFWLTDSILYTPSLACGALAGVTRRRLIELSPYRVQEGEYTLETLKAAEAVILTNAAQGIVPVRTLLPLHLHWQSNRLAEQIIMLRNQDIDKYARRMRESLARS